MSTHLSLTLAVLRAPNTSKSFFTSFSSRALPVVLFLEALILATNVSCPVSFANVKNAVSNFLVYPRLAKKASRNSRTFQD